MKTCKKLNTGRDPRALPDYTALRDELAKLSHPARPDVDWGRVEQLSLALFRHNGVELQTAAWYTLARIRLAGMAGLNEGLAILEGLLTHQWSVMWPKPVHARMEILASFSQRLQSALRTLTLHYADLAQLYRAEQYLGAMRDVLQRLELKNISHVDELCSFMHTAATRLENSDPGEEAALPLVLPPAAGLSPVMSPVSGAGEQEETATVPQSSSGEPAGIPAAEPMVYVVKEAVPAVSPVLLAAEAPAEIPVKAGRPWKPFICGALSALLLGAAGLWGWQQAFAPPAGPLPEVASQVSLNALEQMSPLWLQSYGYQLADGAEPAEAAQLRARWQQHIRANALPVEALSGWHQGMAGLQDLTRRLNELDERRGKYLTGSELKSMVFTITQSFERSVPVEERLYQLTQVEAGKPLPAAQVSLTDLYLKQLLNRYMLIKESQN